MAVDTTDITGTDPARWRVLAITTWQQAGLTFVRFGIPVLAPFLRSSLGLSLFQVGIILGAFNLGAFATCYVTGTVTERLGARRVLVSGAAVTGLVVAALPILPSWQLLALGVAVAGLGFPSSQVAGSHAVYAAFGARERGLAMGVRQAGLPFGGLIAALTLPWIALLSGWQGALEAAALVALSGAALSLAMPAGHQLRLPPRRGNGGRIGAFIKRRDMRRATYIACLLAIGQFALMGYLPLYLVDRFHYGKAFAALSLIAVQVGGVVGRLGWGWVSDRLAGGDRAVPLAGICLGGAAVCVATALASGGGVVALSVLGGAMLLGWNGLYVTMVAERCGRESASALGISMTALYIFAMLAPALFGQLIEVVGYHWAWILLALPQVLAAALAWTLRDAAHPIDPEPSPR